MRRDRLFLQLLQDVADRFTGRQTDVDHRSGAVDAVHDRAERGDARALAFGDGEHSAVVLRGRDLRPVLTRFWTSAEFAGGLVEGLERNERAVIGVDASHMCWSFWT